MKEDATEERPTTDGEQTNEPSQESAVENLQTDTTPVNGEDSVNEENSEGEKGEDSAVAQVEDVNEKNEEKEKSKDSAVTQAEDFEAKEPEDSNAAQAVDAIENEAENTDQANKTEDPTVNGEDNMTTNKPNEINIHVTDNEKLNGDVENIPEKENDEGNVTVEKPPSIPILDQAEYVDTVDVVEGMKTDEAEFPAKQRRLTAYERLSNDLSGDQKVLKEITLGKRIGFYRIRGELGSGNFSQVKMGIHALTKEKVAVKILDKTKLDQKTQRLLSREISSMDKMHHPNIIRLYEVVETLAKLHIVMEYAGGGELFNKITNEGKIVESEAKIVYAQVIAALKHMHEKNIIHRDLKAENVFYAGPRFVKVGDFGFSTTCRPDQTLNTFCGSPPYAAPELFKDEHYYGSFVDIWAMGIMLYFMVCGVMPFRAETVSKLKKCILEGSFVIPPFVSDSCQFLIRGILKSVPHDRFTLSEICRSDWLEGQDFPEALPPYNMNPSADGAELTEEELETRAILHDLGIKEEHINQCHGKDSRSSINGTYRIVLHKVQRKRSGRVIDPGPEFEPENAEDSKNSKNQRNNKKSSKFCVIL